MKYLCVYNYYSSSYFGIKYDQAGNGETVFHTDNFHGRLEAAVKASVMKELYEKEKPALEATKEALKIKKMSGKCDENESEEAQPESEDEYSSYGGEYESDYGEEQDGEKVKYSKAI